MCAVGASVQSSAARAPNPSVMAVIRDHEKARPGILDDADLLCNESGAPQRKRSR